MGEEVLPLACAWGGVGSPVPRRMVDNKGEATSVERAQRPFTMDGGVIGVLVAEAPGGVLTRRSNVVNRKAVVATF